MALAGVPAIRKMASPMIQSTCPRCGRVHHSDNAHRGRSLRCSGCGDPVLIGAVERRSDGLHIELPDEPVVGSGTSKVAKSWNKRVPPWVTWRSLVGVAVVCLIATGMFWAGRRSAKRADHASDWQVVRQVPVSPAPAPATSPDTPVLLAPGEVDDSPAPHYPAKPSAPEQPPADTKSGDIFDRVAAADKQAAGSQTPSDLGNAAGLGATCAGIGCNGLPVSSAPRHATGDQLSPTSGPVGRGKLTLICGTDRDSVVLVVDAQSLETNSVRLRACTRHSRTQGDRTRNVLGSGHTGKYVG
jgi:hypothetical protein